MLIWLMVTAVGERGRPRLTEGQIYCSTDSSGKVRAAKLGSPKGISLRKTKKRTSQREAEMRTRLLNFCVQGYNLPHSIAATLVDLLRWIKCHLSLFHFVVIFMLPSLYLVYYIESIHLIKEAGIGVKNESKVPSSWN